MGHCGEAQHMKEQLLVHSNTALSLDIRADDVHALQVEGDPHHICRHIPIHESFAQMF